MRSALLAIALIWCCSPQAGELVVIASEQRSLEVGTLIDGGQRIEIASGRSVTLIASTGETLRLVGPYSGAIDRSPTQPTGLLQALARLIEKSRDPRTTLAVFRGLSKPPGRPDIWGVNIARSGTYCLRRDREVRLWWPAGKAGGTVTLEANREGRRERIDWPKGATSLAWPSAIPVVDGGVYVTALSSGARNELTTVLMPPLDTDAHRAVWMDRHDCTRQAIAVLNALGAGEL